VPSLRQLRQGGIVWTSVTDSRGVEISPHGVIITSSNEDIKAGREVFGVVCSSTEALKNPRPHWYLPVPYSPNSPCCTKFRKETVAICIAVRVPDREYSDDDLGGYVKTKCLLEIIKKTKECDALRKAAGLVQNEMGLPKSKDLRRGPP
jgi:hypothetical protein